RPRLSENPPRDQARKGAPVRRRGAVARRQGAGHSVSRQADPAVGRGVRDRDRLLAGGCSLPGPRLLPAGVFPGRVRPGPRPRGGKQPAVHVFDAKTGAQRTRLLSGGRTGVTLLSFSPDGKLLALHAGRPYILEALPLREMLNRPPPPVKPTRPNVPANPSQA